MGGIKDRPRLPSSGPPPSSGVGVWNGGSSGSSVEDTVVVGVSDGEKVFVDINGVDGFGNGAEDDIGAPDPIGWTWTLQGRSRTLEDSGSTWTLQGRSPSRGDSGCHKGTNRDRNGSCFGFEGGANGGRDDVNEVSDGVNVVGVAVADVVAVVVTPDSEGPTKSLGSTIAA